MDYLKEEGKTKVFLVGSDYVFPQTANKIINAYAEANGIEIVGEEYAPMGHTDFSTIVNKLKASGADAVFNTLNGDSNVAFFKEYKNVGLSAETTPVVSVSIAEEEIGGIGIDNVEGQLTAWNYYQTVDSPANTAFVEAFKAEYGDDRVTSDPMEAAYTSVYLWKNMVEKAESFDVADIQAAADGVSFDAPKAPSPSTATTTTSPRPRWSARSPTTASSTPSGAPRSPSSPTPSSKGTTGPPTSPEHTRT